MTEEEQRNFVDLIAQAVVDKIDERERINRLADLVVDRVLALQAQEAAVSKANTTNSKLENERNPDGRNR